MNKILLLAAISLLWVLPVQAQGLVRDICVDSPNPYKELIAIHKTQGFTAAQKKFYEIMRDPDSDCFMVPGRGQIPVIDLEVLQEDNVKDEQGVAVCVVLHRVKLKNQTDPDKKYYAVEFVRGTCDKDKI